MKKKLCFLMLCLVALALLCVLPSFAATVTVGTDGTATRTTVFDAYWAAGNGDTIQLLEDTTMVGSGSATYNASNKTVTIDGQGQYTINLTGSGTNYVMSGTHIIFKNVTIDASQISGTNAFEMWSSGSTIEFGEGTVVKGWKGSNPMVRVTAGCHLIISGATIQNCTLIGTTEGSKSDITLASGIIQNCTGSNVFKIADTSTFTMEGGTIQNCSTGIQFSGTSTGVFSGGEIKGTKDARAIVIGDAGANVYGSVTLSGTNFTDNAKGVVNARGGSLNFTGGTISTPTKTVEADGAAIIGAGTAKITISDDACIDGVKSSGGKNGSAIRLDGTSTLTMTGGTIRNCVNDGGNGTVFLNTGGTSFTMTGGTITDNTNSWGGALDIRYTNSMLKFGGAASIYGNTRSTSTGNYDIYTENSPAVTLLAGDYTGEMHFRGNSWKCGGTLGTAEEGATISGVIYANDGSLAVITEGNELLFQGEAQIGDTQYVTLNAAIDAARSSAESNVEIELLRDCVNWEGSNDPNGKHMNISGGKKFTINGNGHKIQASAAATTTGMFVVYENTELTLKNITLDGNNTRRLIGLLYAGNGAGHVILDEGAVLQNGYYASGAGAVEVVGGAKGSTLTMKAGSMIQNCESKSSAVYVGTGCTFTMEGGTIQNCTAADYAGAVLNEGTFIMTAGEIKDNEGGNGAALYNHTSGAKAVLSGGTITGNTSQWIGPVGVEGRLTLSGDVVIDDNITLTGSTQLTVENDFAGKATINYPASINSASHQFGLAGEGLTEIEGIIVCFDKPEYVAAVKDGLLVWVDTTVVPITLGIKITTDAGKYTLSEDDAVYGVIRMFAELAENSEVAVESFGIYVIQESQFDSDFEEGMSGLKKPYEYKPSEAEVLEAGANIGADLRKIPEECFEANVVCIAYIKLADQDDLITKILSGINVNNAGEEEVKDLGVDPELYQNQYV